MDTYIAKVLNDAKLFNLFCFECHQDKLVFMSSGLAHNNPIKNCDKNKTMLSDDDTIQIIKQKERNKRKTTRKISTFHSFNFVISLVFLRCFFVVFVGSSSFNCVKISSLSIIAPKKKQTTTKYCTHIPKISPFWLD